MTNISTTSFLSKFILFLLIFFNNYTSGNTAPTTTENNEQYSTRYTLDTIKTLKVKKTCLSLSDCSEGALECRKDNNDENNSYCLYPDYICFNKDNCFAIANKNEASIYPKTNNSDKDEDNENNNGNKKTIELTLNIKDKNNRKYIMNPCVSNTTNTENKNDHDKNNSIEGEKNDDKKNNESSLLYCSVGINNDEENGGYECQSILEENNCRAINSDKKENENQPPSLLHELKYVFISFTTMLTMALLIVIIALFNKQSVPLEDTDLEKYAVAIV